MNTDEKEPVTNDPLTQAIIGCALGVSNELGAGFLEKVYENALLYELRGAGLQAEAQVALKVRYKNAIVGEYFADLIVERQVLIELKAVRVFDDSHQAQVLNYLKATGLRKGLLLNFGAPRLGIKRLVF